MNLNSLIYDKAKFVVMDGKYKETEIPLQFNPPTYSVEQNNEYSEKKLMGLKGTINQFTGTKKSDLSLELLFDSTSGGGDVRDLIEPLKKIIEIDNTLHAPPPCRFVWNKFSFDGIVATFKKEFTYFYASGTPARAKITLTLKPYVNVKETAQSADMQSSDISKTRVLTEGDTIFEMAYREYKTPAMWRKIAEMNGIDNPLTVPYGSELLLPSKETDA